MISGLAYPAPEPRFARELPAILPLPFRRGEGRGEGSDLGFRDAQRVTMVGESFPKGEGKGGEGGVLQLHASEHCRKSALTGRLRGARAFPFRAPRPSLLGPATTHKFAVRFLIPKGLGRQQQGGLAATPTGFTTGPTVRPPARAGWRRRARGGLRGARRASPGPIGNNPTGRCHRLR